MMKVPATEAHVVVVVVRKTRMGRTQLAVRGVGTRIKRKLVTKSPPVVLVAKAMRRKEENQKHYPVLAVVVERKKRTWGRRKAHVDPDIPVGILRRRKRQKQMPKPSLRTKVVKHEHLPVAHVGATTPMKKLRRKLSRSVVSVIAQVETNRPMKRRRP
jgi:hypothetical protein